MEQGIAINRIPPEPSFVAGVLLARLEGIAKNAWLGFDVLGPGAGRRIFRVLRLGRIVAGVAKILLFAFIVLFLISALSGALRGRAPPI